MSADHQPENPAAKTDVWFHVLVLLTTVAITLSLHYLGAFSLFMSVGLGLTPMTTYYLFFPTGDTLMDRLMRYVPLALMLLLFFLGALFMHREATTGQKAPSFFLPPASAQN